MKLTKPIKAHGEEIAELNLRVPTSDDIMELGFPFSTDGENAMPKAKVVGRYIVKLAQVPMSSVKEMSPVDFMTATAEVMGFFGEETPDEATAKPQ